MLSYVLLNNVLSDVFINLAAIHHLKHYLVAMVLNTELFPKKDPYDYNTVTYMLINYLHCTQLKIQPDHSKLPLGWPLNCV